MTNERALINTIRMAALRKGIALVTPFDGPKAGWKMNAEGTAVEVKDGNPIWIDSTGAESVMQGNTIARLNDEARIHRERAEAAEKIAKAFEGIDPKAARTALETVDKLDKKQLIDAGEVDKVTAQITGQFTEKLTAAEKLAADRLSMLNQRTLESSFASSDFVKDKLALPLDVAQTYFARNIEFDDAGKMTIKDASGNVIRSKTKLGEVADFNEAIQILVETNPNRDKLLLGGNHQGSGNNGGGGGNKPGVKTYRRGELDQMATQNAAGMAAAMAEVNAGNAQIVD